MNAIVNDDDILAAIGAALDATGRFGIVSVSKAPEEVPYPASGAPAAYVQPARYEESDDFTGTIPVVAVRRVKYTLTIAARHMDQRTRDAQAQDLADAAQDALTGVSFGGVTIPAWTKCKVGRWMKPASPERRVVLEGEFARLVAGYAGRNLEPGTGD